MLEPRQIRESELLKKGVKGRYKKEAEQFSDLCADTVEQLMTENVKVRTENAELSESNARMNEVITNLEKERNELLVRLTDVSEAVRDYEEHRDQVTDALIAARNSADEIISNAKAESERLQIQSNAIIGDAEERASAIRTGAEESASAIRTGAEERASAIRTEAEEYAAALREQIGNECAARLARLDSELTRRTLTFENAIKADAAGWGEADAGLRTLRSQLSELLERMPQGLTDVMSENARAVWERATDTENK